MRKATNSVSAPFLRANNLQVGGFAVSAGWLITFGVGGLAYFFAWQSTLLPTKADLSYEHAQFFGSVAFSLNWWLIVSMAWLFVIWGAFRCARIAKDKALGSTIVFWIGPEVLSWPNTMSSGINHHFFYEIVGSGLLCFSGYCLAYVSTKRVDL